MENKLKKNERVKLKEQQAAAVSGKISTAFIALVAALMALIYCGGKYPTPALVVTFNVAVVVLAVLTVAALAWCIVSYKNKKNYDTVVFSPLFVLGLSVSALFAAAMFPAIDATYTILALIAFSVVFFVYEIYPVDFFICTASVVFGCIAAAMIGRISIFVDIIFVLAHLLVVAACALVTVKLTKNGSVKIGRKKIKKPYGMIPLAICASVAVSLVALLGVLFFGHLLYFAAVACAVYFIVAIIYTVKLM